MEISSKVLDELCEENQTILEDIKAMVEVRQLFCMSEIFVTRDSGKWWSTLSRCVGRGVSTLPGNPPFGKEGAGLIRNYNTWDTCLRAQE